MKKFHQVLIFLWFVFWICTGISIIREVPTQIEKSRNFIDYQIKPSVDFIIYCRETNGRLPGYREYYRWCRDYYHDFSSDLTQQTDSLIGEYCNHKYIRKLSDVDAEDYGKFERVDWDKEYAVRVWDGESMQYYFSWKNKYEPDYYSWNDGYIELSIMLVIGILPLAFSRIKSIIKRKSSTQLGSAARRAEGIK